MADVLSQSQIDALLKSMSADAPAQETKTESVQPLSPEEKNYIKYDFFSPRKFTKEKMKILRSVFENYARILTSQINGIFRVMTDITVLDVQERRYYEYVNALHENDCMTMIDASIAGEEKMSVPLMLFVTPGMVITLINHMLGGEDVVAVEDDYRYSDVERALYKRIVEYMTGTLKDGFSNYVSIVFSVEHVEENPTMVQDVGLDETVAIIILNVDISGQAQEKLKICLPGNLLTVIFHSIDNRKHLARGFSYQDNKEKIMDNIRYSKLPITGQLGTVQLDLKGLYQIQVGDVIDLGKDVPKEAIAEAALTNHASIIGLSALMTTTMQEMKHVVDYVHEKGIPVRIMIGGAVITPEYAKEIGADAYSKDAAEAVVVAKRLLGIQD